MERQQQQQELQGEVKEAAKMEEHWQQSQGEGAYDSMREHEGGVLPGKKPARNRSKLAPLPLCLTSFLTSGLPQSPSVPSGHEPSPTSTLGSPTMMSLSSAFSSLSNSPMSARNTPHGLDILGSFSNFASPYSSQKEANASLSLLPASILGHASASQEAKALDDAVEEDMDLELRL